MEKPHEKWYFTSLNPWTGKMLLIVHRLLRKLAANRYLPLWVGIISIAINFPVTLTGLKADDFIHREKVRGNLALRESGLLYPASPSLAATVTDLFTWVRPSNRESLKNYGILPWWSSPDLKVTFFRPVASFTHWIDYRFWPDRPFVMLLENLFWLAALLTMLMLLFRKVIASDGVLLLCAAILLFNTYFYSAAIWVASRYALMAAFFGVSAIFAYHVFRSSNRSVWLYASLVFFIMGLLCGESAAAVAAYIVGYAVFMDRGAPLRRYGFPGLFLVTVVVWRMFYTRLGFGITGSGFYVSPESDLVRYAFQLLEQAPIITASGFFGISLYHFHELSPRLVSLASWAAAALCGLIGIVLLPTLKRLPAARWFLVGLLGALPLSCASIHFGERMTLFVVMGMAPLTALLLREFLEKRPLNLRSLPARRNAAALLLAGTVAGSHLIAHPALRMKDYAFLFPRSHAPVQARCEPLGEAARVDSARELIAVNLVNPVAYYYPYYQAAEGRPYARSFRLLASSPQALKVKRVDSLTVTVASACPLIPHRHSFARITPLRNQLYDEYSFMTLPSSGIQKFSTSWSADVPGMHVAVDSVGADGLPLRASFTFLHSLENASYVWCAWNHQRRTLEYFRVPGVGDSVTLAGAFE